MTKLTIALTKGVLLNDTKELLRKIGISINIPIEKSRKLIFEDKTKEYKFILIRPTDVPVYVEHGTADLGIVGKDVLLEGPEMVAELMDLKYGSCDLVIAAPKNKKIDIKNLKPYTRVATKYINTSEEYFRSKGLKVELIKLYGSVEIAPLVELSDIIVDLASTGKTLEENGLEIISKITNSTARLIANRVSLKVKYQEIIKFVNKIRSL